MYNMSLDCEKGPHPAKIKNQIKPHPAIVHKLKLVSWQFEAGTPCTYWDITRSCMVGLYTNIGKSLSMYKYMYIKSNVCFMQLVRKHVYTCNLGLVCSLVHVVYVRLLLAPARVTELAIGSLSLMYYFLWVVAPWATFASLWNLATSYMLVGIKLPVCEKLQ